MDFAYWYDREYQRILEQFQALLAIASISTDPEHKKDMLECCSFLVSHLEAIGMKCELWPTLDHDTIFASHYAGPQYPTLLLYSHYDVQPAKKSDGWDSDPFHPTIREGAVYARGAVDNKGQCFYTITAIEAFLQTAASKELNIKLIIEGGEEIGSLGLYGILQEKKEAIQSDYMIIVDMDMPRKDLPAITLGGRGIITFQVDVQAATQDVHSGLLGGVMKNPATALAEAISRAVDQNGQIKISGFCDGVHPLTKTEQSLLATNLPIEELAKEFGVHAFQHHGNRTAIESNWLYPTIEVNGFSSGFIGEGFKTVLPMKAMAKISSRIVPGQDPDRCIDLLQSHFLHHLDGLQVEFSQVKGSPAYRTSPENPFAQIIKTAYKHALGVDPIFILSGASIPIAHALSRASGAEQVGIGFAILSDGMHSPNEHFGMDRFRMGFLTMCSIFDCLRGGTT